MATVDRYFDAAFAAPDGIEKLRELILTLGMKGMLVRQSSGDSSASELVTEVEMRKKQLVKEGKVRESRPLPPVTPDEVPYSLPKGWCWVRLGQIGVINPRNEDCDGSMDAGFVPMALIAEGYSGEHQFETRQWHEVKKGFTHVADGDIGMAKITPCFENAKSCLFSGLPNGIGAGTTELHVFRNTFGALKAEFLLYYLKNPGYISAAVPKMTGSAGQKRVPTAFFSERPFPLPPRAEQDRIVIRIVELMAMCDELEMLRAKRDAIRLEAHVAAVRKVLNGAIADEHIQGREFLRQHFGELYTVRQNVTDLRKAILQLAAMGKLVPQNPGDEPASVLLNDIANEKKRLVKDGKIKEPKHLPPIKLQEMPYTLPQGWVWVRLDSLTEIITKGSSPNWQGVNYVDHGNGILFITSENVGRSKMLLDKRKYVDARFNEIEPRSILKRGDLLMNIVGASIGRTAMFDLDEVANINQAVTIIRLVSRLSRQYFLNFFNSPQCLSYMFDKQVDNARPNLSMGNIALFLIPLPPLAEQARIVTKVNELLFICDLLEEKIDAAASTQTSLLNSLMARIEGRRCA